MNKNTYVIASVIIILIAVVAFASSNKSASVEDVAMIKSDAMMKEGEMMKDTMMKDESAKEMMAEDAMMKKTESMSSTSPESAMMKKAGTYSAYSPLKVTEAKGDIVLFFRASWCPSCQTLEKDIQANLQNIPENLTLLDVNYDSSAELKKKYGVTTQHTLVQVSANGDMMKKWSGGSTLADVVKNIQ